MIIKKISKRGTIVASLAVIMFLAGSFSVFNYVEAATGSGTNKTFTFCGYNKFANPPEPGCVTTTCTGSYSYDSCAWTSSCSALPAPGWKNTTYTKKACYDGCSTTSQLCSAGYHCSGTSCVANVCNSSTDCNTKNASGQYCRSTNGGATYNWVTRNATASNLCQNYKCNGATEYVAVSSGGVYSFMWASAGQSCPYYINSDRVEGNYYLGSDLHLKITTNIPYANVYGVRTCSGACGSPGSNGYLETSGSFEKTKSGNVTTYNWYMPPGTTHTGTLTTDIYKDGCSSWAGTYRDVYSQGLVPTQVDNFTVNCTYPPGSNCNLPWGGTLANGSSVTAYNASSVACGSTCVSQTRTCNSGNLSGSYTNSSCSAAVCPAPTLNLVAALNPVAYNTASTLNWTVSNATWCWASNGWTGWKSTSGGGEGTGPLTTAKTYTMECGNSGPNTVTKSVTINANAPVNNASCNSITAPASVVAGQSFSAVVAMNNTGTKVWNSDASPHRLGSYDSTNGTTDNMRWGLNRVGLPSNVNPGGSATFNFTATAPTTPGSYSFDWKMVEDGLEWFGASCTKTISVTAPPTPVTTFTGSSLNLPAGGGNVTLNWSVVGAVPGTCTGYGGIFAGSGKATSGSLFINVPATTTFDLDCWNTLISPWIPAVRASVTVNVCVPTCNETGTHCPGVVYNDSCGNPTCNNGTLPQNCPGGWGSCSKSCGGGTQTRICSCPPENQTRACAERPCPPGYREVAPW